MASAGKNIFEWKTQREEAYKSAVQSFFDRTLFLALMKEWILFFLKDDELQKTILRQHQTRAAVKVVDRCADPAKKTGLIWHTQGSGKTFTLITAARLILENKQKFPGATVMLVVDRNELEGQLSGWVERLAGEVQGRDLKIAYAETKAKLQELLEKEFLNIVEAVGVSDMYAMWSPTRWLPPEARSHSLPSRVLAYGQRTKEAKLLISWWTR